MVAVFVFTVFIVSGFYNKTETNVAQAQAATLLTPADFTYLGYYDVNAIAVWGHGLTHRYINGDLRFLTMDYPTTLREFSIAGKNYGDLITLTTNVWPDIGGCIWYHTGYWWDEAGQKLWNTTGPDYTTIYDPAQICTRTLNSNGTISNYKRVTLEGIPAKRAFGGVQPVPAWFQTQYGVGPYVTGWGGYTSLAAQGGGASFGSAMYSFPDISNLANDSQVPSAQIKTLADHGPANSNDWYASGSVPTSYDRGVRLTVPINYFDGGDLRPNGICSDQSCNALAPINPPASGAQWLSPAPDGKARFVWGDNYKNTGNWIDTPTKKGFISIANLAKGKAWYCSSTLCSEQSTQELHIFDPDQLGQAALGSLPPWKIQPSSMMELNVPRTLGYASASAYGKLDGATFDPVTNRLYIMGFGISPASIYYNRLYVYQVNAGATTPPPPPAPPGPTPPPPPPTGTDMQISANPTSISSGGSSTLNYSWNSSTRHVVKINGTAPAASCSNGTCTGTMSVSPTTTTTYTMTAVLIDSSPAPSVSTTVTVTSGTPILGDINLDRIVNSVDYSILNSDWFTSAARSDLNSDGLVNAIDYSILNANWFRTW
ncbi:MAG: hypothetical protein A2895_01150 [Candidatus Doudnabacteria bacterium RIFCSPLOWO2_01_FULL_42_60]|nr:MAG: hypothetical protein A3K07_03620 [Candidatus Doudnabacteria bacterium RIFCSPHIGHO2_01_43_10]OGE91958.1 MAG: hypothetical protein A2895_01150 [Candidatus Doudnabacteria bacterium RIFCSPLOWO2_01_FULL_42_60]